MVEPKAFQDALLAYHARPCDAEAEAVRAAALPAPFSEDQIDELYLSKVAGRGPFDGIRAAFHAMVRTIEQAHGIGTPGVQGMGEAQPSEGSDA